MPFHLSNEKAIDILIWWIEGSDGSIDYREEKTVERILKQMDYSLETFYQETMMHLSGLGSERLRDLVDDAIRWGARRFSEEKKQTVLLLLSNIAASTGEITGDQQEKLDRIREEFRAGGEKR